MKKISLIMLITGFVFSGFYAQSQRYDKGAQYCSHRKSMLKNTPANVRSENSPRHRFDVLNYKLNMDLWDNFQNPFSQAFDATETVTFRVDTALNQIKLDAVNTSLTIHSVGLAGTGYTHLDDTLTVQLDRIYNPGEIAEVSIDYSHKNVEDEAFYVSGGFVFTDCETEGARKWFPCYDRPADKATVDITAKVPGNVLLGSNGRLADSVTVADTTWYRWISRDPIEEQGAVQLSRITSIGKFLPRNPIPAGTVFLKEGRTLSPLGLRFTGRDLNDYVFVRGNPLSLVDPLGLVEWARTGVFYCKGYNKNYGVWDTIPSHTYVRIDGIGYGFYSKSWETGTGSSGKAVYDEGIIVYNDHERYPERNPSGIPDGSTYAICTEVEVSACCYDANKVKGYVLEKIKQGMTAQEASDPTTYSVVVGNCTWWAKMMIQDGIVQARRSTWGCTLQTLWYGPEYLARPAGIW